METSFGTLEPLLKHNNQVITELAVFEKEGRSHSHDTWEICYVLEGKGAIMEGEKKHFVKEGDTVHIPPKTRHWMIPEGEPKLKILIVYSSQK